MKAQLKEVQKLLDKMAFLKEQIAEELQAIMEIRIDHFDEKSEKWQESEKGEEFQALTDEMENFADEFDTNIDDAIRELENQIGNF
jgi:hemerythrin superfamily protein